MFWPKATPRWQQLYSYRRCPFNPVHPGIDAPAMGFALRTPALQNLWPRGLASAVVSYHAHLAHYLVCNYIILYRMIWILWDLNYFNRTCWWLEVSGIAFLQHHGKHHQASPHVPGFAPNCVMQWGGLWQQLTLKNRPSRSADVSCTTWFLLQSWFKQGKLLTFKAACPGSCPTSWHSVQEHGLGALWCHPFSIHLHPKLLIRSESQTSSQLSYSMLQRCFAVGSKQKRTSAEAPFGGKQLPCNEGMT